MPSTLDTVRLRGKWVGDGGLLLRSLAVFQERAGWGWGGPSVAPPEHWPRGPDPSEGAAAAPASGVAGTSLCCEGGSCVRSNQSPQAPLPSWAPTLTLPSGRDCGCNPLALAPPPGRH